MHHTVMNSITSAPSDCGTIATLVELIKADQGQLNITEIITLCPEICRKLWGDGNPDLDGVGVS